MGQQCLDGFFAGADQQRKFARLPKVVGRQAA